MAAVHAVVEDVSFAQFDSQDIPTWRLEFVINSNGVLRKKAFLVFKDQPLSDVCHQLSKFVLELHHI